MVAVTLLLASTVHVYVFSYAEKVNAEKVKLQPPQAGFTFDGGGCDGGGVAVTHSGGGTVDADQLYLRSPDPSVSGPWADPSGYSTAGVADGTVDAGDSATVCADDLDGATVRLIWVAESGDESIVLIEWRGGEGG